MEAEIDVGVCICGSGMDPASWKLMRAAIGDAINTIERERLYEGSLDEERRILGVLRGVLNEGEWSD